MNNAIYRSNNFGEKNVVATKQDILLSKYFFYKIFYEDIFKEVKLQLHDKTSYAMNNTLILAAKLTFKKCSK